MPRRTIRLGLQPSAFVFQDDDGPLVNGLANAAQSFIEGGREASQIRYDRDREEAGLKRQVERDFLLDRRYEHELALRESDQSERRAERHQDRALDQAGKYGVVPDRMSPMAPTDEEQALWQAASMGNADRAMDARMNEARLAEMASLAEARTVQALRGVLPDHPSKPSLQLKNTGDDMTPVWSTFNPITGEVLPVASGQMPPAPDPAKPWEGTDEKPGKVQFQTPKVGVVRGRRWAWDPAADRPEDQLPNALTGQPPAATAWQPPAEYAEQYAAIVREGDPAKIAEAQRRLGKQQ